MIYVTVKCAITLDGYLDDSSDNPLQISSQSDFEHLDLLRSQSDAILIGAETFRRDNPNLLIKSSKLLDQRIKSGFSKYPIKIVLTNSGNLNFKNNFFTNGDVKKLIICNEIIKNEILSQIDKNTDVLSYKENFFELMNSIEEYGIKKLLIQGGAKVINLFLEHGMIDELWLTISNDILGQTGKSRLFEFLDKNKRNMNLKSSKQIDNQIILNYVFSDAK